jgi:hypothetical protein
MLRSNITKAPDTVIHLKKSKRNDVFPLHFFYYLALYQIATMDDTGSLPVMKQPRNMMEVGPNGNNLEAAARRRHLVDDLQRQSGRSYLVTCS